MEMIEVIVKTRVKRAASQTKEELLHMTKTAWNELDGGFLSQLVSSFPKRFEMVIRARGRSISLSLLSQ
jgi:hypothetical protein